MKKYQQFFIALSIIVLLNVVPMHAAQEQETNEEVAVVEEPAPVKKESLSLRQRVVKQLNESINRLKKCAKLQCDRTEFLKALRDVAIAGGAVLAVRSGYQYATQDAVKEWKAFVNKQATGSGPLNTFAIKDKELERLLPMGKFLLYYQDSAWKIVWSMLYQHDPRFEKIVEAVPFDDARLRDMLYLAIRFHNTDALNFLLNSMSSEQINKKIGGWTPLRYASKFRNKERYAEIIDILQGHTKIEDKTLYSQSEKLKSPEREILGGIGWGSAELPVIDEAPETSPASPKYKWQKE